MSTNDDAGSAAVVVSSTMAWLEAARATVGTSLLMPLAEGSKRPLRPHAIAPGAAASPWTPECARRFVAENPEHATWGLLLDRLCVVDADDEATVAWLKALSASGEVPELGRCPCQVTRKGRHYLFARPDWADAEGFWDGARQVADRNVDLKTRCSTGTRGVLVVAPSVNKAWLPGRAPWEVGAIEPIPRALMLLVAKPRGGPAAARTDVRVHPPLPLSLSLFAQAETETPEDAVPDAVLAAARRAVMSLGPLASALYERWFRVGIFLKSLQRGAASSSSDQALFAMFDEFSRRNPSKYDGRAGCHDKWQQLPAGGAVTVRTLRFYAQEEGVAPVSPEDMQMIAAYMQGGSSALTSGVDEGAADVLDAAEGVDAILCEVLSRRFPELGLDAATFRVRARTGDRLEFEDVGVAGSVEASFRQVKVTRSRDNHSNVPKFLGLLHQDVACDGPMTDIHASIPAAARFVLNQESDAPASLKSTTPGVAATLTLHRFDSSGGASIYVDVPGRPVGTVAAKGKVATLRTRVGEALDRVDRDGGLRLFVNNGIINNGGTINITMAPADEPKRTDNALVHAVLEADPKLREMIKFAPASKTGNCNGLYCCDPATSVWAQQHNVAIEEMLMAVFGASGAAAGVAASSVVLTDAERKHVESRRGRGDMVHMLAAKVEDVRFLERLDANLDVFAVANGCFDTSERGSRPVFRPLKPGDYVSTTAGWPYDPEAARQHRGEVDAFFEKVLPVPEERHAMLSYFASLLSGRRKLKKFLALTDEREGDNGKSTMLKLFTLFFGAYVEEGGTKFVCRGSFDRDRDSHDAGTELMRGKRLVVAEELKHTMTLDDAMLKRLVGGAGVTASGRRCGSNERWQFVWQAAFVLVFNDGDMPKFDSADAAFLNRMAVGPMRSKFVEAGSPALQSEPWTFVKDPELSERFPTWLSAVADVLVGCYGGAVEVFDALPEGMREWRRGVTAAGNPVAEWCDANFVVTGESEDFVVLGEVLDERYGETMKKSKFARLVAACYKGVAGVTFCPKTTLAVTRESKRDVLKGVKLRTE
jgi:phage/plasmid-associated DNA primase